MQPQENLVGLKIFLTYNHFITVIIPEVRAKDYIQRFTTGFYQSRGLNITSDERDDLSWVVLPAHVIGMHTFDPTELIIAEMQKQQAIKQAVQQNPQQLGALAGFNQSGLKIA